MDNKNSFNSSQIPNQTPVFNAGSAIPGMNGNATEYASPMSSNFPGAAPQPSQNPRIPQTPSATAEDRRPLTYIVIIIIASLVAVTFVGLFIWMYARYSNISTDVNGQINEAVALAVDENTKKLESDFTEREKSPYKTFAGPADYGEVTFEYPKTWSVYVDSEASRSDGYTAYFHPNEVSVAPYALRFIVLNESYDEASADFADRVEDGELTVSVREVGGSNANIYTGMISDNIQGIFAILKIRDKAIIVQTDALVFEQDFYRVLDTLTYKA